MNERDLFIAALHLTGDARAAFLAAGADAGLRGRVESMLLEHDRLGGFLEPQNGATAVHPGKPGPNSTVDHPGEERGEVIAGKYKLTELIGEGGMGSVWRAQQSEPVKRSVAVKLIRTGMDSRAVLARFEAERQALAVMDHPNIAKILDGGVTEKGSPFFVMELVKGVPMTEFCDARKLTPKQRLELFVPVCQAIQHAHQKGIIHRDIKPSNVLIALYDDRPVPKVIDFGIAKAAGGALTDNSYHTAFGGIVGTPEYMSPEQASLNNLDIDTRSDVYSLGVLLYELLAGSPPFRTTELKKAGMLEMLRVVREDEPPRPSTKLSTAATLPSISANRGTEPKKLAGLLRNELDWIVMKALEKDRARRYESANGFAADVQRYLAGDAVQAHPPSAGYRIRKLVRRHKGRVAAGGAVTVALVGGLAGTTWQAIRADREADRVRAEEQKTRLALTNAERSQQLAERFLVQSYLRPVGYQTGLNSYDPAELYALSELSELSAHLLQPSTVSGDIHGDLVRDAEATTEDRLKLLCLTEALSNPETAYRTARRAERFVQAVVGASPARRKQALEIVAAKQRDPGADVRVRFAACWFALELRSDDLPAFDEACRYLMSRGDDELEAYLDVLPRAGLSQRNLETLLRHLLPDLYSRNWDSVSYGWSKYREPKILFVALGTAACSDYLIRTLESAPGEPPPEYVRALADLAATMTGAPADRAAAVLTNVVRRSSNDDSISAAANVLRSQGRGLDPAMATKILGRQLAQLDAETSHEQIAAAARELNALIPKLDAAASAKAAASLTRALSVTTLVGTSAILGDGLVAVAPRLSGPDKDGIATRLRTVLTTTVDEDQYEAAARGMKALAPDGSAAEIAAAARRVAVALAGSARSPQDRARGLRILAPYFDAAAAAKSVDELAAILAATTDGDAFAAAATELLTADAARFGPAVDANAVRLVDAVIASTAKDRNLRARWVAATAPRLRGGAADRAAKFLADALSTADGRTPVTAIIGALGAIAPHLDAATATKATEGLAGALAREADPNSAEELTRGLLALLPRLDAAGVERLAAKLEVCLAKPQNSDNLRRAVTVLATLTDRMGPAAQAKLADVLLRNLNKNMTSYFPNIAAGCSALAGRLDRSTAARATEAIVPWIVTTEYAYDVVGLGEAVAALAPRLAPDAAARAAGVLQAAFEKADDVDKIMAIGTALKALAPDRFETVREQIAAAGFRASFKQHATSGFCNEAAFRNALRLTADWRAVAKYLAHAGCIGPVRDETLRRLEELLVRPRPDRVPEVAAAGSGAVAAGFFGSVDSPHKNATIDAIREKDRRFRTSWDAVEYILTNHPDYRFEAARKGSNRP